MRVWVRTCKEFDLMEMCQHLLVAGDLSGDCFNCKEVGLDYNTLKSCPKCKTDFRFISSRKSDVKTFSTLQKRRDDLIYVEFSDVKQHKDRQTAKQFFS